MSADHGTGVGGSVKERLFDLLGISGVFHIDRSRLRQGLLILASEMDSLQLRLERIENGEKKTENGITPTCGNTGGALRNLDILFGERG